MNAYFAYGTTQRGFAGGATRTVFAYLAAGAERRRALARAGRADALPTYPPELAAAEQPKPCCLRAPGHAPPHDIVDPLAD